MGHVTNPDREYRLLQQHLDRTIAGAPDSPTFMRILKLLFEPADAALARRLPLRPMSLSKVARGLRLSEETLGERITELARRGLVVDVESDGRRYVVLAPVVIGFFEFTFMRHGHDAPLHELAKLFELYFRENDKFAHSAFQGSTQFGRALVREEALPPEPTFVLDWERATALVKDAKYVAVSMCACRHKASHLGKACEGLMRACLTLGDEDESYLVRAGLAERISHAEAEEILAECKRQGMVQTAENVQRGVGFICNCCGCCCGMLDAIKTFHIKNAVVSSNWVATVNRDVCTGCQQCARACPLDVIGLEVQTDGQRKRGFATVNEDLCLGCGVCHGACDKSGIVMKARPQRVHTPEDMFDKTIAMAIERGRLAPLIFGDPTRLSHRALGRIAAILERSPPWRAAMAIAPLRSTFLNAVVRAAR